MARTLTKKQQTILINWNEKENKGDTFVDLQDEYPEVYKELERINDYETLWQDANRFIFDMILKEVYL